MKSVLKLDLRTARLLHSSQSINSVSSIVKEIVENSLDAGATNVIVKLVDYGLDRIEVTDNGHGVTEEDLPLVVLPGYTSKIRRSEDLLSLATYGFRGQALAAVVAVSRVTVASGPQDSGQGLALGFDLQGNIISRKVLPWNGGTRVTVEDVFKNIPVRRKHMDTVKAKSAQLKKVQHFLHAVAIACPGVGFSLHHNKSIVWSKVPVKTMREAIGQVYGINALQGMHYNEAHDDDSGTTIKLFAPAMGTGDKEKLLCSSEPDKSIFLVNGRPVYIKELSQLLQKEFLLALGAQDGSASKHPICVASIEVSPSELDVNLEPDKTAVAFARKDSVFELFSNLVKKAFSTTTPKEGTNDLTSECSTEHPSAQNECQSNLEVTDNGLDHLFDDFEMPESVCEDLERQMSKELPATPDGNKENESSFAVKTVAPPTSEVELAQAVSKNVPEAQVEKTVTPTKRSVAPLRVPERQASLWSLGILQNSQGKTVAEPTRVGGGSVAEKRPMLSPAKDRTPCKKMRTPTKTLSVRGWLKDVLGTRERSAKEIFCAHRKKEILSQVPEMPLMELSECLEEEWTSLTPDEKQNYETQAKNASSACEKPTTAQQQPRKVSGAAKHATATWKKVELQFSMKDLKECFEDYCHLSQQPPCLDTTLVGPLQGCPGDAWVVWHKARLCTLNTVRLREAVTFRRLVATFPLPSEKADPPMSLTANVLGGDSLWNTLLNMKKESRDASGTLYVTDPLLTCNGFHVRILADCKAEILQLPKDQALSELVQILKLVSLHASPTVASSRLPRTAAVLREEATRMVRNMAPKMSRDEIEELLTEGQGDLLQELCVHNRPVCTQFFDMSTSTGSAAKDSLTQQIVQ